MGSATGPDSGVSTPSLMVVPSNPGPAASSFASPAVVVAPASASSSASRPPHALRSVAVRSTAPIFSVMVRLGMVLLGGVFGGCCVGGSVRKRPCLEVRLGADPDAGQAVGFEHQVRHDGDTEQDLIEG